MKTIKYCTNAPEAVITANGTSTICKGDILELSVSPCNGCTYHWSTNETKSNILVAPTIPKSYQVTVSDSLGCYRISQPFNVTIFKVDTSISITNGVLTAHATNAQYEWLNCNDTVSIGVTTKSFTPSKNGEYRVKITQNNCIDTSECRLVIVTDIGESNQSEQIKVYPNPVSNVLRIEGRVLENKEYAVCIYNSLGEKLDEKNLLSDKVLKADLDFEKYAQGIYFVAIRSTKLNRIFKVQKF